MIREADADVILGIPLQRDKEVPLPLPLPLPLLLTPTLTPTQVQVPLWNSLLVDLKWNMGVAVRETALLTLALTLNPYPKP